MDDPEDNSKQNVTTRFVIPTDYDFLKSYVDSNPSLKSEERGGEKEEVARVATTIVVPYAQTIEVVDEDSSNKDALTARMKEYIGQLEYDLKELGLNPVRAIIRPQAIREVDIFLKDHNGYLKTIIDRGAGVTAEDALRMLKYLEEQGITDFEYIDLRVDNKAYWR